MKTLQGKRETWEIGSMRTYAFAPQDMLPKIIKKIKQRIDDRLKNKGGIAGDVMQICDVEDEIELRDLEGYEEFHKNWAKHYNEYTLPMMKRMDEERRTNYRKRFKQMVIDLVDECIHNGDSDLLAQFKKDIKRMKITKNK